MLARTAEDTCLIEGPRLLAEALAAGLTILEAATTPKAEGDGRNVGVFAALQARGIEWRRFHERLFASLSPAEKAQGILAIAERPKARPEALFAEVPLVLVIVGIQDPGNVGGLVRSAEGASATGALLTTGTADPFGWKALRGSMGSSFRLPLLRGLTTTEAVALCHDRGLRTAAAVARGGVAPEDADLRGPLAVLVGSEAAGLPDEVAAEADLRLTIALAPDVESLNVGVAAGILLFEAARQRRSERVQHPSESSDRHGDGLPRGLLGRGRATGPAR